MTSAGFGSEAAKLSDIRKVLESTDTLDKPLGAKYLTAITEMENVIFSLHRFGKIDSQDILLSDDIKFLQNAFCDYETSLEERNALEAISGAGKNVFGDRVLSRTVDYAITEGKFAGIGKNDKVLVVGSGPFPETAIAYAESFRCNVTCVEKELRFCEISRELIETLGLSEKIKVANCSGEHADVSGFDKVLVTILTKNRGEVLKNVSRYGAEIIARTSFGSSCLIYEPIGREQLEMFHEKRSLIRWGKNFTSSLLLEKK
ncbi:MAG: hypothetical protein HZB68_05615 [Candidatus Aenigmarchaeota archaeon]|nr:hypothetical protein [Candidatus Aenigmarchaeota archaeon]